ncbi:MAG TPA: FAD-dependent monooxygenase [Pyrinomonadaceae bacterium]|nr:FAD-dependent monooxygenase [Pyrinomonadaceae bacterium]
MNTSSKRQLDPDGHAQGRHAVVLGGSLAGLLTARVLSDHFDEVTLIERDVYTETTEVRRGIPQGNHVHGLLLRGRQVLEEFFPGLQDEMIAAGVPLVDMANDIAWYTRAGWGLRFPSEMKVLAFTRPVLDLHVRRRLSSNPRVKIMDNTDVLRLIPDGNKKRVAGVLICPRHSESDRRVATELHADLVVDTTGRASRAPRWLNDLGYVIPEETVVDAHLGYASRMYRIPDDFNRDWKCAYVQSTPPKRSRGAILFEVEGNRWLVTLTGGARDYPPSDEVGFLEFARSLPVSTIYDAMCAAEPITPIKTHRGTENRLRHFDRAKVLPENFLLLGDAVCAFNPVYGQGMTIAALGALTLRNTLREDASLRRLSRRFQKRLGKVNKAPWLLATGEDYRYPETKGDGPGLMTKFMHRYMNHVLVLATESVAVRHVLLRAFSMLVPPTALFHPRIALRVLVHVLKERKLHENADGNHRRERQVGGRQQVPENRLVS